MFDMLSKLYELKKKKKEVKKIELNGNSLSCVFPFAVVETSDLEFK